MEHFLNCRVCKYKHLDVDPKNKTSVLFLNTYPADPLLRKRVWYLRYL